MKNIFKKCVTYQNITFLALSVQRDLHTFGRLNLLSAFLALLQHPTVLYNSLSFSHSHADGWLLSCKALPTPLEPV